MIGWRFASKDDNSLQGERSRRDPASPSRRACPTGAQASFRRCPVRTVAAWVREDPRPSRAEVSDFLDGRPDVGLRHVFAEGPLLAGLRGAPQRREPAEPVWDRPRSLGHAHARDPRPRGTAAVAALVRRRLSPTPAWQGPGAVRVLPRMLLALLGRHRVFFLLFHPLRLLPGKGEQADGGGHLSAPDAGRGADPPGPSGSDSLGSRADREARRQREERLRAERGQTLAAANPPGTSRI